MESQTVNYWSFHLPVPQMKNRFGNQTENVIATAPLIQVIKISERDPNYFELWSNLHKDNVPRQSYRPFPVRL